MIQTERCPFCNEGKIEVLIVQDTKRLVKGPWGGNKPEVVSSMGKMEILSKECPNCGKTKKEIEGILKNHKEPSREDVLRRLKEAGLDPSKLK